MGLFSYGSSTLGGSSGVMGSLLPAAPTPKSIGTIQGSTYTPYTGGGGQTPSAGWSPGGLAAGPVTYLPKKTTAAPAPGPTGPTSTGGSGTSWTAASSTPYTGGGGGGGGGSMPSFSFDFSNNSQGPALSSMPQPDWSGLFSGMSSLMDKSQQGDVPGNVPLSTQKDTMQLQGLRESAAGWRDLAGPGGSNPALGQRILPDESKKLAALQTARIY